MKDEFYTPLTKWKVHEPIYVWMSQFVNQCVVVDVGCGDGLGNAHLASRANALLALDRNVNLLAASRDSAGFVHRIACDGGQIPLRDGLVDVVTSIALLEYLPDPWKLLEEAVRILKPGGTFLCGTKNVELSIKSSRGGLIYRNHAVEYSPTTLLALLSSFFGVVDLYGLYLSAKAERLIMNDRARAMERKLVNVGVKSLVPRGVRKLVRRLMTGVRVEDLSVSDFPIREGTEGAYYLLAKCSF